MQQGASRHLAVLVTLQLQAGQGEQQQAGQGQGSEAVAATQWWQEGAAGLQQ